MNLSPFELIDLKRPRGFLTLKATSKDTAAFFYAPEGGDVNIQAVVIIGVFGPV
jgi:hypothetical protein